MASSTEEIKNRIDLADFIGAYLKLQKAGRNFKALCPFHQEKTPSFIVTPDKQIWHCFGCNEGGDIFKFLMRYENLEFYEALKFLAEKAGVEIQQISPAEQKEFNILYGINEAAKFFFQDRLKTPAAKPAFDYLLSRGLKPETIEEFELGWGAQKDDLSLYLLNAGFDINDIRRAGLAVKTESGINRDRFNNRVIFPLYNNFGKVVGFTGRILSEAEPGPTGFQPPKYLNSQETPIFNKSRLLYGYHKSKKEISRLREAFLVEGQMDFLMAWQSGVKNAVAVSGTALGVEHLRTLRRTADVLTVSFDKDEAGVKALERVLDAAAGWDFFIKAIDLGAFKDPAEAAAADPDFLTAALQKTQPALNYLFNHYFGKTKEKPDDLVFKKNALIFLIKKILNFKSPIDQAHWFKELALRFDIEEKVLVSEGQRLKNSEKIGKITNNEPASVSGKNSKSDQERHSLVADRLLTLVLAKEDFWPRFLEARHYFPVGWRDFLAVSSSIAAAADWRPDLSLRSAFEFSHLDDEKTAKEFSELLKNLKLEFLKKRSRDLKKEITALEKEKNQEPLSDCLAKFQAVSKEINSLL